jgi:hypothetical protein
MPAKKEKDKRKKTSYRIRRKEASRSLKILP